MPGLLYESLPNLPETGIPAMRRLKLFASPRLIEPAPAQTRRFLTRHSGLALAAAAILLAPLAPYAYGQAAQAFDRPVLLAAAPETARSALEQADRHILVVRHARKADESCNAIDCPLGEPGEAMVAELAALIGEPPVDAALASAACRTVATAEAGGVWVTMHRAADTYALACGGGTVDQTRTAAMTEARESLARWTLVGEHSNTACLWVAAFAGDQAADSAGCVDGALEHDAYGDVFWLHRVAGDWQVALLPRVFDVDAVATE